MVDDTAHFAFDALDEATLSTRETAVIVGVTEEAIHQRVRAGRLVPKNRATASSGIGKGYRFSVRDVRALAAERAQRAQRRAQRLAAESRVRRAAARLAAERAVLAAVGAGGAR